MAGNKRRVSGRDKLWARVRAEERICHLCHYPIDYNLRHPDRRAFELDERIPVSMGGSPRDYDNVDAAHRCCNQWRGNKPLSPALCRRIRARYERTFLRKRLRIVSKAIEHSREW